MSKVASLEDRRKELEEEKEAERELCKLNTLKAINAMLREYIEEHGLDESPTSKT